MTPNFDQCNRCGLIHASDFVCQGHPAMTALERAARAVYDSDAFEPGCWTDRDDEFLDLKSVVVDGRVNFNELARAVLMAVREPDRDVVQAGRDEYSEELCRPEPVFTAMIDAILNEKDTTND